MTRVSIRRLDVIRAANIAAVLYAVIILAFGLILFVPFVLFAGVASTQIGGEAGAATFGGGVIGAILIFVFAAVAYAIFGWIFTAILVALFNLVAGRMGGLRADVVFESMPPGGGLAPYGSPPGYGQPQVAGQPPTPPANWGQPQG